MPNKTRDLRRYQALIHARQRRRLHLSRVHLNQAPDCACERAALYFSKRRAFGCNCRKKKPGAPRVGTGDKFDAREAIYAHRRAVREVLGAVLSGRVAPDAEEVSRVFRLVLR
jgi:hypothetical protein